MKFRGKRNAERAQERERKDAVKESDDRVVIPGSAEDHKPEFRKRALIPAHGRQAARRA